MARRRVKASELKFDPYKIITEDLDGAIKAGIRRGLKHMDVPITEQQIEIIAEQTYHYVTNHLCEKINFER